MKGRSLSKARIVLLMAFPICSKGCTKNLVSVAANACKIKYHMVSNIYKLDGNV